MDTLLKQVIDKYATSNHMLYKQLAAELDMSDSLLSRKLSGRRKLSLEDAHKFACLLGTSIDVIYLLVS